MPPKKRCGGDRRRSSDEKKRICYGAGETTESGDKILVNSFKGHFGDAYPKGVWIHKKASRRLSRNVVSLASFNGGTRLFACTGFFIDWNESQDRNASTILTSASLVGNSDCSVLDNKIFDGLRIEVLLPKGQRVEGTLMHYDLHYNVTLVSVKNYTAASPAILKRKKLPSEVIAVGRCFESGDLMASRGELVGWSVSLDCDILQYSTCKITKEAHQ